MILPSDDSVALPPSNDGEIVVDETNSPAPSLADTQALLPGWARRAPSAMRDAWLAAWGKVASTVWARTSFLLGAQQSPRFAEGTMLDWHGDRYKSPRSTGESDADYRARLLAFSDVVSPNAIKAIVAAQVAKYSPLPFVHLEPAVDGMYLSTTTSPWQAFLQTSTRRLWANYPDRPTGWVGGAYLTPAVGVLGSAFPTTKAQFWVVLPYDSGDVTSAPTAQPANGAQAGFIGAAQIAPAPSLSSPQAGSGSNYAYCVVATTATGAQIVSQPATIALTVPPTPPNPVTITPAAVAGAALYTVYRVNPASFAATKVQNGFSNGGLSFGPIAQVASGAATDTGGGTIALNPTVILPWSGTLTVTSPVTTSTSWAQPFTHLVDARTPLIESVAAAVEPARAGGVTWLCFVDPLLATAI